MTDDPEIAAEVERLALHGLSVGAWARFSDAGFRHYEVVEPGFKFNMTDVQASLGLHQLPHPAASSVSWRRCEPAACSTVWRRHAFGAGRCRVYDLPPCYLKTTRRRFAGCARRGFLTTRAMRCASRSKRVPRQ